MLVNNSPFSGEFWIVVVLFTGIITLNFAGLVFSFLKMNVESKTQVCP